MGKLVRDERGQPVGVRVEAEQPGDVIALPDVAAYYDYRCVPVAVLRHVVALLDQAYSADPSAFDVDQIEAVDRLRRAVRY